MKTKRIRIKTKEAFFGDIMDVAKRLDKGQRTEHLRGEFFESLEAVRNVLTEKRLALWRLIRDKQPGSILELSRLVKRDFKSVHRDIGVLVAVGLIELKREKGKRGDTQRPMSLADALRLEVA